MAENCCTWNGIIATFRRMGKYRVFVLVVMMLTYMVNQLDVFCLIATNVSMANEMEYGERECVTGNQTALDILHNASAINGTCGDAPQLCDVESEGSACEWYYLGLGWEYQLLAGPIYIIIFSISGIPLGLISEMNRINRQIILGFCCLLWGVMTVLGGVATEYWHLAVTRLLLGVFSAGCVPFAASIISDYFPTGRGASLGFFNWGVYVGYSFTFLLIIAEKELGWRSVYFIAGFPAVVMAIVIWVTVREPRRQGVAQSEEEELKRSLKRSLATMKDAFRYFLNPVLLLVTIGGAIRNGAGFVWAFNIVQFFNQYHPGTKVEEWMSWIPLIFGSIGAFGGGYISDRLSKNRGTRGRLFVLIGCCVLSVPFLIGTLFLPMPWAFISNIPAYVIGEMWIGVCVAVVVDRVPSGITTSAVAIYFFVIQVIGGNMNLFVTPITNNLDLRLALVITYPGFYLLGAFFFFLALLVDQCCTKREEIGDEVATEGSEKSGELSEGNKNADVVDITEPGDFDILKTEDGIFAPSDDVIDAKADDVNVTQADYVNSGFTSAESRTSDVGADGGDSTRF